MRRIASHILARLSVLVLIAVALGSSSFAHPLVSDADADLAAFLEAGGTITDICDDGPIGGHLALETCEACNLANTMLAPDMGGRVIACGARRPDEALSWTAAPSSVPQFVDPTYLGGAPPLD